MSGAVTLNIYAYGMKYRGFAPGCQPMEGYVDRLSEKVVSQTRYHDILLYNRELTKKELRDYEMDQISVRKRFNCGNCKWHDDFSWACCNGDSPYCADFTDNDAYCEQYEPSEQIDPWRLWEEGNLSE